MNIIEKELNKDASSFNSKDIIKFIKKRNIDIVNFRYVAGDGRLKVLNFPSSDIKYLERILECGERVDGSSLFKNLDASSSDLYVVPVYKTAFLNPFNYSSLDIICSFFDKNGNLFESAPDTIVRKASETFLRKTGFKIELFGELEYYVISKKDELYPMEAQRGYHESFPFNKWESLRIEALNMISKIGAKVKYAHSEVGFIRTNEYEMTQNEIEFLPDEPYKSAYVLLISKWILQSLGYKYGVTVTFAPKISVGHAGSGLHIHCLVAKNSKNVMLNNGNLSDNALKLISGLLKSAKALTAFGNTIPISYLRLVPHQEAPVKICWGYRNRSALIRVPLAWDNKKNMCEIVNHHSYSKKNEHVQTVEFRAGDGSANICLYIAAIVSAILDGFEMKDFKKFATERFVSENVFDSSNKNKFESLPSSCWESADELLKNRFVFEKYSVFSKTVIDSVAKKLKSYSDMELNEKLYGKEDEIKKIVEQYIYY
ncbi:MAG: glutamine synthetase family protein [Elusimicrobiales bacterium]|nr:glutamine synthetase family protein [Elusimicrobiales bacterium]